MGFQDLAPFLLFPCHLGSVTLPIWSEMAYYHISTSAHRKREKEQIVGVPILFKSISQKLHTPCLLTDSWPHLAAKKAGKFYLNSEKPSTQPNFIPLENKGRYSDARI